VNSAGNFSYNVFVNDPPPQDNGLLPNEEPRLFSPQVSRRFKLLIVSSLAALCLTIAACGGSTGGSGSTGGTSGVLVVVSPVGVPSLDSQNFGTASQEEVLTNVGEPLLRFKPLGQTTSQGIPVGSQTQFTGGACARFSLTAATFHCTLGHWVSPDGNSLTSADVKFTFEYLVAAKSQGFVAMQLAGISATDPVTVISPSELNINLINHNTTAEAALTYWSFDPLDATEVKKHATSSDPFARHWLAGHTAMFGPYNVRSFTPDQEVDLVGNPHYAGRPTAQVPRASYPTVVYRAVPSDGTRAQLLCSGNAQFAKAVNVNLYQPLKRCPSVTTYRFPYLAEPTLYFNLKHPPFDNENLRKAISCAVNTHQISQGVYDGQWAPATSIITPKIPGESGDFVICPTQNMAAAKSYLKASGYAGQTLPLYYSVGNSGQDAAENATLIQADLSQAGVKTSLQPVPDATRYFTAAISGQYGMFVFLWGANVPTAAWALGAWFGPTSALNGTGYATTRTAADLHALQTSALDSAAQRAAAIDFQKQLLQHAVIDPLIYMQNEIIVHRSVCGLRSDPDDFPFWQYLHPCR
jgi:peptide/nickel transport system substrate-binding protein